MRVLDLFSGIGGFSLGLERAGMRTVAFCEIDPYCRAVLAKHWPGVPIHGDIRDFPGVACDLICGGFPCQDVSVAGKRAGLDGARSGLWYQFRRIIRLVQPRWVIVENTPGLLSLGMGEVLGDLAALGYDAEWHCIPASSLGASHRRDRVWIVARSNGLRELQPEGRKQEKRRRPDNGATADTHSQGSQERFLWPGISDAAKRYVDGEDSSLDPWRLTQPSVVRALHGIPRRVDRIRALGNAVVPQDVEMIGRAIMGAA